MPASAPEFTRGKQGNVARHVSRAGLWEQGSLLRNLEIRCTSKQNKPGIRGLFEGESLQ